MIIILSLILLIIAGNIFAFFSAIISSLSLDELNTLAEKNSRSSKMLNVLKLHIEGTTNVFMVYEVIAYLMASTLLSWFLIAFPSEISQSLGYWSIPLFFLALLALIHFSRILFYALGSRYSFYLALPLVGIIRFFHSIGKPVTKLTESMLSALSGKKNEEASRDDINALVETAHEEGSIETDEYRILKNIMHFSDVLVSDVMTPRIVIFSCMADSLVGDVVKMPELQMYSRFPIWEGKSLDDGIVGYVLAKDILLASLKDQNNLPIRDFAREVYIIPENAELDNALDMFLKRRQHLFVVVDEYGGVEGLLTMEDVMETILGVEIVDEADKVVDLRESAKHRRDKRIAGLIHQG